MFCFCQNALKATTRDVAFAMETKHVYNYIKLKESLVKIIIYRLTVNLKTRLSIAVPCFSIK